ncbi:N-acetylmuramoyl-L-alanine amidase [Streptomyces platensis]|uniref:N-acetylmuramoyl-L-alanine amidase n=1 Tax=Streptomyces platensis TaxID=58346 RepID=UPI002ED2C590|nr:N-acetylmuramoyl-L-alanine amidase [Streptomyces platensis]
MARMSGATWRPISINFTKGGQDEVRGVVVHIMVGTLPGSDSWFRNPKAQASSHFGTGKTGALYQWVDTKDRAWAQANGNRTWISVENEGQGGDTLTTAQLQRNAEVLAWAHKIYGVPLQVASGPAGRGLGWHGMGGAAWGGHTSCPGSKIVAQLPEIVRRAKAIVGQADTPAPDTTDTYTVKAGDTLSAIGRKLGVKWEDLAAVNGLRPPYAIAPGDKLKVPGRKPSTPAPKPADTRPVVDLSKLIEAAKTNPPMATRTVTYSGVRTVKAALVRAGLLVATDTDGHMGVRAVKAYAAWQRRCGHTGQAADGIPGLSTLSALAAKYGFRVTG